MTRPSESFDQVFRENIDALYRLAHRMLKNSADAEDAVQDAFLRLARRSDQPASFESARAWVFRIVRNGCIDRLRWRARRAGFYQAEAYDDDQHGGAEGDGHATTPEAAAVHVDRMRRVEEALALLTPLEAEAVALITIEGMSYAEAAEAIGAPVGTIRSRLHRARRSLRAALHEDGEAEASRDRKILPFKRKAT